MRRRYGSGAMQYADFYPGRAPGRQRTIIVVHGGFWRPHRSLDMTAPVAEDLASRGWNAWNIEYRRVGQGSWPATLEDCAAAIDHLAELGRELSLDLSSVLVLGHSAGGHLAVWSAARDAIAAREGRSQPPVRVVGAISVAGILDLGHAARTGIGAHAVSEFVGGGPEQVPDRYQQADPMRRLPTRIPVRCVHSPEDERVPSEQSMRYVDAAWRAGDDAELIEVEGRHADVVDPRRPAWDRVVGVLEAMDVPLDGGGSTSAEVPSHG